MTREVLQQALEALESIALAGMSPSPEMSDNGIDAWHARQAWSFIGIAARALDPIKAALAQPEQYSDIVSDGGLDPRNKPEQEPEAWLLESTQTLAKTLAREFYPEVTQWECLNDLAGVISQIDNMTTGLMRKPNQEPVVDYKAAYYSLLEKYDREAQPEQEPGLPSLKDLKRSIRHRAKTEGYPCHFCGKHFCNHGCLKD